MGKRWPCRRCGRPAYATIADLCIACSAKERTARLLAAGVVCDACGTNKTSVLVRRANRYLCNTCRRRRHTTPRPVLKVGGCAACGVLAKYMARNLCAPCYLRARVRYEEALAAACSVCGETRQTTFYPPSGTWYCEAHRRK